MGFILSYWYSFLNCENVVKNGIEMIYKCYLNIS